MFRCLGLMLLFSMPALGAGFVGDNFIQPIHQRECAADKGLEIVLEVPHKKPMAAQTQ